MRWALFTVALVVAVIYFAREVLLPLTMAILLTFLLTPPVRMLERCRLKRVPAVLMVMLAIVALFVVAGGALGTQLSELVDRLPEFKDNLQTRLQNLASPGGRIEKLVESMEELSDEIDKPREDAQAVRLVGGEASPMAQSRVLAGALVAHAASIAMVLVLVVFMLCGREDLRNRLVRLAGTKLALTTRALDEVGVRISRYLLWNAAINGGFGLIIGFGLWTIGVEYAIMWGVLAGLLRFLPYIGAVVGASLPIGMSILQSSGDGWQKTLLVIGLFLAVELITSNVVEPLTYGSKTGVSTVALLVMAMFWTWVWGPLGLVLAVPLTVVLAVVGEHVSALEPLAILLGDKPPLAVGIMFYQRLLAGDLDEAEGVLGTRIAATSFLDACDQVVVPALIMAEQDCAKGELLPGDREAMWESIREFLDTASPRRESEPPDDSCESCETLRDDGKPRVIGCPAHDAADEIALDALGRSLDGEEIGRFRVLPVAMLVSEMVATILEQKPDAVCISSLGHGSSLGSGGGRHTRYLCTRIRQALPGLRIIVGRWGHRGDGGTLTANLKQRGADRTVFSLLDAFDELKRITPVAPAEPSAAPSDDGCPETRARHDVCTAN